MKFPSIMRKPNPIDVIFKDQAKFDTQNPLIGMLLTQIKAGKLNQEKQIEKQFIGLEHCRAIKRTEDFN